MADEKQVAAIRERFARVSTVLDEQARRLVEASEALSLGRGGITLVSQATGLSCPTISKGITELQGSPEPCPDGRIRRSGGGRKRQSEADPSLLSDLERLVEPTERGDSQSPLRWTLKSVRRLSEELCSMGHRVCRQVVANLLHERGYSLQSNRKTKEPVPATGMLNLATSTRR